MKERDERTFNVKQDNPWIIGQDSIAEASARRWVKREPAPSEGELLKRELGGPKYIREALGL